MNANRLCVRDSKCRPQSGSDNIHHASPRNNFLNHDLFAGRPLVTGSVKLPSNRIDDVRCIPRISVSQWDKSHHWKTWCNERFMNKYVNLEIVS
jgi:hypothetical protein